MLCVLIRIASSNIKRKNYPKSAAMDVVLGDSRMSLKQA